MNEDRELLFKIQRNVDAVRSEIAALRADFERAGLIGARRDENKLSPPLWTPPILNRLGDMIKIVAQSNVATTLGRTDTAPESGLDKPDPMLDPPPGPGVRGKNFDPTFADPSAEDPGDPDPTPLDQDAKDGMNPRDPGDNDPSPADPNDPTKADPKFHVKDDDDDEQHHKDGKLDKVEV